MTTPDKWVIVKLKHKGETFYKVLAGWSGSYLEGQSWRMNSGIAKVEATETHYLFTGFSGSVYQCSKNGYGTNMIMNNIVAKLASEPDVEILPEQNFTNLLG